MSVAGVAMPRAGLLALGLLSALGFAGVLGVACGSSQGSSGGGGGGTGAQSSGGAGGADGGAASGATDAGASADGAVAQGASGDGGAEFSEPTGADAERVRQLFNDGTAAYNRGDLAAAATAFRQVYEIYPNPAMAFNVGRVYERMGEVAEATRYYQIVLAANPPEAQRADINRRITGLQAYEQRRREGIAQPLPSDEATSREGYDWFQRGMNLFRRRQYRQALIAFEQAYQYLQTPEIYYNLAVTHERLGNTDRALEFLRDYLSYRRGTAEEAEINAHIEQLERRRQ